MSAGHDAHAGRRAALRIAVLGLGVGGACLLSGAAVLLAAALDMLPTAWPEAGRWVAAKHVTLAAAAVVGTILVSVGAVFALLERIGVLAALTVPRQGVEPGQRHGKPESELRRGDPTPTRSDQAPVPAPGPDHRVAPSGAQDAEPGASRFRGTAHDDRQNSPAGGVSGLDATGAVAIRSGELSQTLEDESGDAAGPEPEVQPPEPRAPATGTAARTHAVEELPPPAVPQPGDLIAAWNDYRRDGDGHFSRRGLQEVLDKRGVAAEVSGGDRVGAGGTVLIVEAPPGTPQFYVLPSFNKSPRAVAEWFDDNGGRALTGRTQRVTRVAHGRWIEPGTGSKRRFEVIEKGEVA